MNAPGGHRGRTEEMNMDSRAAAQQLGTDSKTLRRFLRHPSSSFSPVGSGGRYEFTDKDVAAMTKEFIRWLATQTPRESTPSEPKPKVKRAKPTQSEIDRAVWDEEGTVVLPDIRDPRVRDRVRAEGMRRAAELDEMLLAAGLHISQWRERV